MKLFLVELEDARAIVSDLGGDCAAFDISAVDDPLPMAGSQLQRYTVTVRFNSMQLKYKGGYRLDWLALFEEDIRRGVFGGEFAKVRNGTARR